MGRVYLAEHTTLRKQVAVKILHHKYMGKRDLIKRFQTEALASSRLNHPNVVSTLDFGEDESGLLGDQRILHITVQVLRALEEAHGNGIIHRDLKPENILLEDRQDQVDQVHVLDFGLAKALDGSMTDISRITAAGSTCGTPE